MEQGAFHHRRREIGRRAAVGEKLVTHGQHVAGVIESHFPTREDTRAACR